MICMHCKKEISDENKYCAFCGSAVEPTENNDTYESPDMGEITRENNEYPKQSCSGNEYLGYMISAAFIFKFIVGVFILYFIVFAIFDSFRTGANNILTFIDPIVDYTIDFVKNMYS